MSESNRIKTPYEPPYLAPYRKGDIVVDNCRGILAQVLASMFYSSPEDKYQQWYIFLKPLSEDLPDDNHFVKDNYWIGEKCLSLNVCELKER